MSQHAIVMRVLKNTSRTFYLPVVRLPGILQETIASAYLCMRAVDEIEDHRTLDTSSKVALLNQVSLTFQAQDSSYAFDELEQAFRRFPALPEVTVRLREWAFHAPISIAPRIWDTTAAMAERMAYWVSRNWQIISRADLDRYTFSVAGAVGLLLCDIWAWFDGTQIDRLCAIHFGRGLQAVNILRNRTEDLAHNVDFFPIGWTKEQMFDYAQYNLNQAKAEISHMPRNAFKCLVEIPLLLAEATLDVLKQGKEKLSRSAVLQILRQVESES
jgi:farnesyl-diphosphate farnesyltransferase